VIDRRAFLAAVTALLSRRAPAADFANVIPGRSLAFPRDHGRHAEYRTEWWYLTGWVRDGDGRDLGIQITFFRNRPGVAEDSRSAFAPRQLLFAHAAIADPALGRLRHDQRAAREGFGLAQAADATTDVAIGDWSLVLAGDTYRARLAARDFGLSLDFRAAQPILLQGEEGYSRKGPTARQASHYYSRPHLAVTGSIEIDGRLRAVGGEAWLDHEWSSDYLAKDAAGWDWAGINLDDGGALMTFRIRGRNGGVPWAGGVLRRAEGSLRALAPDEVSFTPQREWTSPRTGTRYPVAMHVRAAGAEFALEPLFDDQELDSRASTGTVYWEGAVTASDRGRRIGRGYLELTGYGAPLVL
jgi:predicted secreted hydrolase